jgi:hypothetical protein
VLVPCGELCSLDRLVPGGGLAGPGDVQRAGVLGAGEASRWVAIDSHVLRMARAAILFLGGGRAGATGRRARPRAGLGSRCVARSAFRDGGCCPRFIASPHGAAPTTGEKALSEGFVDRGGSPFCPGQVRGEPG